jgi:hypothetical protein
VPGSGTGGDAGGAPAAASGAGGTTSAAGVPVACAATAGFRSVAVATHGGGLSFSASRAVGDAYGVDVFQQSAGRRVLAQRLVARFGGRTSGALAWAGKKDRRGRVLQDGYYVVRFRVKSGAESDVRRITLRRAHGTFTRRPDFYGRAGCTVIRSSKLSGPTFGGSTRRPLGIAFQLARAGSAKVTVAKGGKTVLTRHLTAAGRTTRRVELPFRGTTPGDYVVTIAATTNRRTQVVRLTSRRL